MEENKTYNPLKIVFSVLLFGGLWGILEATLGTFLHLPIVDAAGMYACSTTIMVPIAMYLMGACYKRTGTFRSCFYMGALAGAIKAIVCAIFVLSFRPVFYIILESLCMGAALAAIRPTKIISYAGLATFILANTSYLILAVFIRYNMKYTYPSQVATYFETYVFKFNCLAILYVFASGALIFGLMKLAERFEWKFEGVKKIIYSPITASVVATAMVAVTFLIR